MFSIIYDRSFISVVTPDVMASNGVIHVIDKVILPRVPVPQPPTPAPPIVPGLNLCILNLFASDGRVDAPIAQVNIVRCGPNEVCQKMGGGQFGQYG